MLYKAYYTAYGIWNQAPRRKPRGMNRLWGESWRREVFAMEPGKMPEDIISVVDSITEQFRPIKIYLFSNKRGGVGKTAGFKLCVILDCADIAEAERGIYLGIDCEVPFDVVLYTPSTWEELCERKGSFAQRILKNGVLLYG